jgi:hypothetical protein
MNAGFSGRRDNAVALHAASICERRGTGYGRAYFTEEFRLKNLERFKQRAVERRAQQRATFTSLAADVATY